MLNPYFNSNNGGNPRPVRTCSARPVLRLSAPSVGEVIDLEGSTGAKKHLRVEHTLDDDDISEMIIAAREYVEEVCWRGLLTQTWEARLAYLDGDEVELPRGNLQSVTSITYVDGSGATQTWAADQYSVDSASEPGRVLPAYGVTWPSSRQQWDAVKITYVVGWVNAGAVPRPIVRAMKLLISQMYEHRTPEITGTVISSVQFAVDALLAPYRMARF